MKELIYYKSKPSILSSIEIGFALGQARKGVEMADWEVPAKKNSILKADWEGLNHDLLALILEKVTRIEDCVAFGMVCKSWYKAFASNKRYLRRPQTPWLMLPEKKTEHHHRRIFSLSKQDVLTNNLYIPEMSDKRCIGLNYGWVLTISSGKEGEMRLLHPLSRMQIELPPQTAIKGYEEYKNWPSRMFTKRAALSADPLGSPSDFVLMIIYGIHCCLGYWRPGDREWTRIQQLNAYLSDLNYYQDQFYAISWYGEVTSYKFSSQEPVVARRVAEIDYNLVSCPCIVGNAGTLLVITREVGEEGGVELADNGNGEEGEGEEGGAGLAENENGSCVDDFQVYELDLIGSYKQITSIGDRAIFVGDSTSICLDHASQFPGVKSNHIYYTDDRCDVVPRIKEEDAYHMGSYDIQNGQIMLLKLEESLNLFNPPFWFIPSL